MEFLFFQSVVNGDFRGIEAAGDETAKSRSPHCGRRRTAEVCVWTAEEVALPHEDITSASSVSYRHQEHGLPSCDQGLRYRDQVARGQEAVHERRTGSPHTAEPFRKERVARESGNWHLPSTERQFDLRLTNFVKKPIDWPQWKADFAPE